MDVVLQTMSKDGPFLTSIMWSVAKFFYITWIEREKCVATISQ